MKDKLNIDLRVGSSTQRRTIILDHLEDKLNNLRNDESKNCVIEKIKKVYNNKLSHFLRELNAFKAGISKKYIYLSGDQLMECKSGIDASYQSLSKEKFDAQDLHSINELFKDKIKKIIDQYKIFIKTKLRTLKEIHDKDDKIYENYQDIFSKKEKEYIEVYRKEQNKIIETEYTEYYKDHHQVVYNSIIELKCMDLARKNRIAHGKRIQEDTEAFWQTTKKEISDTLKENLQKLKTEFSGHENILSNIETLFKEKQEKLSKFNFHDVFYSTGTIQSFQDKCNAFKESVENLKKDIDLQANIVLLKKLKDIKNQQSDQSSLEESESIQQNTQQDDNQNNVQQQNDQQSEEEQKQLLDKTENSNKEKIVEVSGKLKQNTEKVEENIVNKNNNQQLNQQNTQNLNLNDNNKGQEGNNQIQYEEKNQNDYQSQDKKRSKSSDINLLKKNLNGKDQDNQVEESQEKMIDSKSALENLQTLNQQLLQNYIETKRTLWELYPKIHESQILSLNNIVISNEHNLLEFIDDNSQVGYNTQIVFKNKLIELRSTMGELIDKTTQHLKKKAGELIFDSIKQYHNIYHNVKKIIDDNNTSDKIKEKDYLDSKNALNTQLQDGKTDLAINYYKSHQQSMDAIIAKYKEEVDSYIPRIQALKTQFENQIQDNQENIQPEEKQNQPQGDQNDFNSNFTFNKKKNIKVKVGTGAGTETIPTGNDTSPTPTGTGSGTPTSATNPPITTTNLNQTLGFGGSSSSGGGIAGAGSASYTLPDTTNNYSSSDSDSSSDNGIVILGAIAVGALVLAFVM